MLLGDVVGDERDPTYLSAGVLQWREVDGPRVHAPLAAGALEALQVARLAAFDCTPQPVGQSPGLRLRGDLIDAKAPDGIIRQADDGCHGPVRAAVSEVGVVDRDGTVRQLVEDPVGQIVVLRPRPHAVQRADETPRARSASRGVVMRDDYDFHAPTVTVSQRELATPPF